MAASYADMILDAYANASLIAHHTFDGIRADEALAVQDNVMKSLGKTPGGFKVALSPEGKGIAAPIFADRIVQHGQTLSVSNTGLIGLEFELALVLGKTVTPEMAAAGIDGVLPAVDHFIFGIEIVSSRFDNQKAATPAAQLADNLSAGGYIKGNERFDGGPHIDGAPLVITVDGVEIFNKPAKHPFGNALQPVIAYALSGTDELGVLQAGSFITTGSLCGAVAFTSPCEVVATIHNKFTVQASLTR